MKMYMDKYIGVIVIGHSFPADTSLQQLFCISFRKKYFGKYGYFKRKRVYFNVLVTKNKTILR